MLSLFSLRLLNEKREKAKLFLAKTGGETNAPCFQFTEKWNAVLLMEANFGIK